MILRISSVADVIRSIHPGLGDQLIVLCYTEVISCFQSFLISGLMFALLTYSQFSGYDADLPTALKYSMSVFSDY